jgi:hypothetical protein
VSYRKKYNKRQYRGGNNVRCPIGKSIIEEAIMSVEYKGELLKDIPKEGKLLKKEHKGDILKSEGDQGNPLWKDTKLNEDKKKKKKINESEI